jgi:SAM-dependent methyltransferase
MSDVEPESLSVWRERGVDVSVAQTARRYDYWLGGKDHFPADRASGDAVAAAFPAIRTAVRENRRFLARAVGYLAGEAGIDQFLDIGTGIPSADNTHEVAQRANPAARVVYVDNDPIVLSHARALLISDCAEGVTACLDADLREPEKILNSAVLAGTLDLSQPVALLLVAVLHFVPDEDRPHAAVRRLVDALPPGSHVVITHGTNDFMPSRLLPGVEAVIRSQGGYRPRTRDQIAGFLDGLELVEPGLVPTADWRPAEDGEPRPAACDVAAYAAVARV